MPRPATPLLPMAANGCQWLPTAPWCSDQPRATRAQRSAATAAELAAETAAKREAKRSPRLAPLRPAAPGSTPSSRSASPRLAQLGPALLGRPEVRTLPLIYVYIFSIQRCSGRRPGGRAAPCTAECEGERRPAPPQPGLPGAALCHPGPIHGQCTGRVGAQASRVGGPRRDVRGRGATVPRAANTTLHPYFNAGDGPRRRGVGPTLPDMPRYAGVAAHAGPPLRVLLKGARWATAALAMPRRPAGLAMLAMCSAAKPLLSFFQPCLQRKGYERLVLRLPAVFDSGLCFVRGWPGLRGTRGREPTAACVAQPGAAWLAGRAL